MLEQILEASHNRLDWKNNLPPLAKCGLHIAVTNQPFLNFIFDGKKTVESRFSLHRIAPYNKVAVGDVVFLKSGPVVGYFVVGWTEFAELNPAELARLQHGYSKSICADENFWRAQSSKKYATLIGIKSVCELSPLKIDKRDKRGWVVLK